MRDETVPAWGSLFLAQEIPIKAFKARIPGKVGVVIWAAPRWPKPPTIGSGPAPKNESSPDLRPGRLAPPREKIGGPGLPTARVSISQISRCAGTAAMLPGGPEPASLPTGSAARDPGAGLLLGKKTDPGPAPRGPLDRDRTRGPGPPRIGPAGGRTDPAISGRASVGAGDTGRCRRPSPGPKGASASTGIAASYYTGL